MAFIARAIQGNVHHLIVKEPSKIRFHFWELEIAIKPSLISLFQCIVVRSSFVANAFRYDNFAAR